MEEKPRLAAVPVINPLQSKTLWMNFIFAGLALFVPAAQAWIVANPLAGMMIPTLLNFALRWISKGKIEIT